jgi:hypothetical protein
MNQLRVATTTLFLLLMLFVQETIINRINFPWHSFSLYLAALLVLLAFEDRTGALVFGFLGGLVMDLSLYRKPREYWRFYRSTSCIYILYLNVIGVGYGNLFVSRFISW